MVLTVVISGSRPRRATSGLNSAYCPLAVFQVGITDEDGFRPACGKGFAAVAGAGLDHHRMALRAARDGKGAGGVEVFSFVLKTMDLCGVGEQAGSLVDDEGAIF